MENTLFHLDSLNSNTIKGWVYKPGFDESIVVRVLVNDNEVARGSAVIYRKGLHSSDKHPTGNCGFEFSITDSLKKGDQIQVFVQSASSKLQLVCSHAFMPDKTGLFIMHIAKTGGTSINAWMKEVYGQERIRPHVESARNLDNPEFSKQYNFISGHLRLSSAKGIMNLDQFYTAAVFRNPINHLVSHLCWVKHVGSNPESELFESHHEDIQELATKIQSVDFADGEQLGQFLAQDNPVLLNLFDNCQVRYLLNQEIKHRVGFKELLQAKANLDSLDIVGITERLGEFMITISEKLKIPVPKHTPELNKQQNRYGLDISNQDTLQAILPMVAFDQIIYHIANDYSK
jgi:hypothetical protein